MPTRSMRTWTWHLTQDACRVLFTVLVLALVGGCATHATLRVNSEPMGAYITEVVSGRVFGVAPTEAYYDPDALVQYKDEHGCYRVRGFQAQWVSGARAMKHPILLCSGPTATYEILITRNPAAPGLGRDIEFALQVQALIVQREQANAAQISAAAALSQAFDAARQRQLNCTTRPGFDGQSIVTNCR